MSVSVHDLQSSLDNLILEGVAAAQELSIFVKHRDRWIRGCRAGSPKQAAEIAETVFQRSGLPVEVRSQNGRPLIEIDEDGVRCCDKGGSHAGGSLSADDRARACDPGQRFVCVR